MWTLTKLAAHLAREKICVISRETLRRLLRTEQVSWQKTKTWKVSTDPQFLSKMLRILDLYDHPPTDGRVICVDEFGPLNLQPCPGKGWWPTGAARKLQATFTRTSGLRHMLAALDLATGKMLYRIRARKRWREFLDLLKVLRAQWPTGRLYLIMDNFSPHPRGEAADWCTANDIELVFLPTNASWLNRIETEFTALRYFALNGSDYRTHAEQSKAIGDYIRWRNRETKPKTNFAINSKTRSPGHQAKVPY